jgi:TRAP-type C4-dicarboxylate transport system permease small subunit
MKNRNPTNKILDEHLKVPRQPDDQQHPDYRGFAGKANRWLAVMEKFLNHAAAFITLAMMLLTVAEISLRKLAGVSIEGVYEGVELMLVAIVYLGLSYVQHQGKNIRVEILLMRLPFKAKQVLEAFTLLLTAAFVGIAIWMTGKQAWASWLIREITFLPAALPIYVARAIITVGFFFLWLRLLFQIGERIYRLSATSGNSSASGR